MRQQVLSIEQMKRLQELGLDTSNASIWWARIIRPSNILNKDNEIIVDWYLSLDKANLHTGIDIVETIPTFTLQNIIELLPYKIVTSYLNIGKKSFSGDIMFYMEYSNFGGYSISSFKSNNMLDAAYEMLCWCVRIGYVKTTKK